MQYKNFTIENFKGIEKTEIDFTHDRILPFVGLNESGKTTILDAISMFYNLVKDSDSYDESDFNNFRPKGDEFTGQVKLSATLLFSEDDKDKIRKFWKTELKKTGKKLDIVDTYTIVLSYGFDLHKFKKSSKAYIFDVRREGSAKALSKSDKEAWTNLTTYIDESLIPEILFYEDFVFEIPEKVIFNLSPDTPSTNNEISSEINIAWQKVLDDVLMSVNPRYTSFQEHVVDAWNTDNPTAKTRITKMEGKLNEKITKAWKALFVDGEKKINFKEIRLDCSPEGNDLEASFAVITDDGTHFSINERSKGCKWFFSFLLFTEFRKNRSENILFLLDEPASNLHSSAQAKILNAIEELSSKSMIAYSTHSHFLLRPDWLKGTYVVINENLTEDTLEGEMTFESGAKVSTIKYFKYIGTGAGNVKTSYFQPILDLLDYSPSVVEPVPDIIITEGKNDWYTLKYVEAFVRLGKKYNLNFYPGGGADQLWDIIRLYLSWGCNFIVLLDGDEAGETAKAAYLKEFGVFLEDKIFTLKDILGQEWAMEGLFSRQDKESIINSAIGEGVYETLESESDIKNKFNLSINQLLISEKKTKVESATKTNFKKLLNFLEGKQE